MGVFMAQKFYAMAVFKSFVMRLQRFDNFAIVDRLWA
jgi:hypothetical protein